MLESGTRLPSVPLLDTTGRHVALADETSGLASLVFFMRSTNCAICTRHAKDLDRRAPDYQRQGVRVFIAIPEGRDDAAAWKAKHKIEASVVFAATGSAHDTIGLTRKVFGSIQQSGTILIDPNGTIRYAHASTMPTASYHKQKTADAVEAYNRSLQ